MCYKHATLMLIALLPVLFGANFSTYWNIFSYHCKTSLEPVLKEYNITYNKDLNISGEEVALFYEFTFGRYPYYKNYTLDDPINYGTPQNRSINKTEHLRIAEYNITSTIREKTYTTLAIVDFEEWRPLFRQNVNKKRVYQVAAQELTKEKYPGINGTLLNETAVKEYEIAAKDFIVTTLKEARRLRPNASWGLYGFPYCNYNAGKNESDYTCSQTYRDFNDEMMYIFNESTALFPSIYLGFNASSEQRFRYVQAILREANRIAQNYDPPLPIYPYTKFEYDPLEKNCSFYDDSDLCSTIKLPARMGVSGLIFWSSSRNMQFRCKATVDFVKHKLGPIVQNVTRYDTTAPPFNISTILNYKDICYNFRVPVASNMTYGNLCPANS